MKKSNFCLITVGLLFLVFVTVASVSASSITVKSPIGGETWQRGTTHTVTWSYTDFPAGAPVKLILLKADADIGTIITSTSIGAGGTGSFTWPIGSASTLSTGNNFKVKVQSVNQPTVFGTSPAVFTLTPAGTTTPPAGGTHFGQWDKSSYVKNVRYTASTDGFVVVDAYCAGPNPCEMTGVPKLYTVDNVWYYEFGFRVTIHSGQTNMLTMPVRAGDRWMVEGGLAAVHIRWLPLSA